MGDAANIGGFRERRVAYGHALVNLLVTTPAKSLTAR
jgi:hypothetical protein